MNPLRAFSGADERLLLAAVVAIGLALRVAAMLFVGHTPESDELAYRAMAASLLAGEGIVDNMGNRAMYNVGYPLFVIAPVSWLFGDSVRVVQLANAVLGAVSVVLCYCVAAAAGAGRGGRLIAAAAWALYLPASVYGVYLLKENLMVPLMLGVVWCALRLASRPALSTGVVCGVLFGALALSGNAALALALAVAYALMAAPVGWRRRLTVAAAIAALAIAVATPWMVRNLVVLGAPVLNTNGGFNLYLGNNPAATGMFVSIGDTPHGEDWQSLRARGEVEASAILRRDALAWIADHPGQFAALALKKALYFWTPPIHEGKGPPSRIESMVRAAWALQFFVLAGAALACLAVRRLWGPRLAVLMLAVAAYTAVHMLFYVIFRYREPIMPVVCVLAALALEALVVRRVFPSEPVALASRG